MLNRLPAKLHWFSAIILVILFLCTFTSCQQKTQTESPLNVLFIGNSYTSANSLPTVFQKIAFDAGRARPEVKSDTPGGYTFKEHLDSSATRSMISGHHWDVVIMQEQSEVPSAAQVMPEVNKNFLDGAKGLYKLIKDSNPDSRIILFETWARHADLWTNGAIVPDRDGKSPADMLQRLKAGYEEAAQSAVRLEGPPIEIARVGELWDINYKSISPIRLHDSDGSHPNFAGSYLAALDIYVTVYGIMPEKLNYRGSLEKDQAEWLRELVSHNLPNIQNQ